MEYVGFSPTRQASLAPSAKRRGGAIHMRPLVKNASSSSSVFFSVVTVIIQDMRYLRTTGNPRASDFALAYIRLVDVHWYVPAGYRHQMPYSRCATFQCCIRSVSSAHFGCRNSTVIGYQVRGIIDVSMLFRRVACAALLPLKGAKTPRQCLCGAGRNGSGMRARGRRRPLGALGGARHDAGR